MFESVQQSDADGESAVAVDVAPLIDIVFILLIFFMTTTTLLKDQGMMVDKPQAGSAQPLPEACLRIAVMPGGAMFLAGKRVEVEAGGREIRRFAERHPGGTVVVVPDRETSSGHLVAVMDLARQCGVRNLAIATREAER